MKQVCVEVKMRCTKCMDIQTRVRECLCSAQIYIPHISHRHHHNAMRMCFYVSGGGKGAELPSPDFTTALLHFVPWESLKFHLKHPQTQGFYRRILSIAMFDVGIDLDDAKGIVLLHFEKD